MHLSFVLGYFLIKKYQMSHSSQTRAMSGSTQIIDFRDINQETSCALVDCDSVEIHPSSGDHITGSSNVRMNNVVDYSWEEKYYEGQLLAVHMLGKYIAYCIKAPNNPQWSVRVINRDTGIRSLIKGMEGTIEDLAFAHIPSLVVLAILDRSGTLLVYQMTEEESSIQCKLFVHINCATDYSHDPKALMRVYWCPYVPDAYDKESFKDGSNLNYHSPAHQLAVTWGHQVEIWHVSLLKLAQGVGPHSRLNSGEGRLQIDASQLTVTDAAFSPDGTAIAFASEDGKCKFYQVYMPGIPPMRCLHEWEPHEGYPVTTLFFLDDYVNVNIEVKFWKYALTGANNGTEFKLWSCETWDCLQKLTLSLGPMKAPKPKRLPGSNSWKLKVAVDIASNYIFLSDMYSRLFYVLKLGKKNEDTLPRVTTITEFKMPCPILSFGIVQAGPRALKMSSAYNYEDVCNEENEKESQMTNVIDLYLVQPKSLQQCHITFKTTDAVLTESVSATSQAKSVVSSDDLNEIQLLDDEKNSLSQQNSESGGVPLAVSAPGSGGGGPILMTPDAFNSLGGVNVDLSVPSQPPPPVVSSTTATKLSPNLVDITRPLTPTQAPPPPLAILPVPDPPVVPVEKVTLPSVNAAQQVLGGGFVSGGSSPSREVEEILAKPLFLNDSSPSKAKANVVSLPEFQPETILTVDTTLHSLKEEVESLSSIVLQLASDIKIMRRELETSEQRVGDTVETNITRALSGDKGGSKRIRCFADLTPVQTVLSEIREDVARNLTVGQRVTENLKEEIKPVLQSSLEHLKTTVQTELSRKLNDQALKDAISKTLKSKPVLDSMTSQLSTAATTVMEQVLDNFVKTGLPLFERATANMLQQINHQFSNGLMEYKKELDAVALKYNERCNLELAAIQAASEHISRSSEKLNSTVDKEIKRFDEMTGELNRSVAKIMETSSSVANMNNGSVRSRTVTPACPVNDIQVVQMQVSHLLKQNRYNEAFQQALSVSDLPTVIIACEKADPEKVFKKDGSGCPLQQFVLLSLIQQISNELTTFTNLKLTYIEGALLCLDDTQLSTREHIPTVLTALQKQLQMYINGRPSSTTLQNKAKMLLMAVNYMVQRT